eukprot:Amastigsp_a1296_12.p3 type:complete len:204 gc:universal Amastigsp_a1296_12:885-1496(+)
MSPSPTCSSGSCTTDARASSAWRCTTTLGAAPTSSSRGGSQGSCTLCPGRPPRLFRARTATRSIALGPRRSGSRGSIPTSSLRGGCCRAQARARAFSPPSSRWRPTSCARFSASAAPNRPATRRSSDGWRWAHAQSPGGTLVGARRSWAAANGTCTPSFWQTRPSRFSWRETLSRTAVLARIHRILLERPFRRCPSCAYTISS